MASAFRCDICKRFSEGKVALKVTLLTEDGAIAQMMGIGSITFEMCKTCAQQTVMKIVPKEPLLGRG